ncbi:phosphoethanolamine transferase [Providencia sp. wls1914]|uniref:phosphoethanolamine transferase n=1 Tax=Providencia sp. wls1914 TaxID=2675156 RepID=UPI0012B5382B|nr:sulfatase-like hydrolase/transferase [Providencia sp. wls1914]
MKLEKSLLIKVFWTFLAIIALFYTSKAMLVSAGSVSSIKDILLLTILIIILSSSKKAFWLLLFPMALLYALYSPIGLMVGKPNYQYVASVFATDLLESKEFLSQIPVTNFFYPCLILAGIFFYRYITVKMHVELYRNKTVICIFVIVSMINQSPSEFFKSIIDSSIKVKEELAKLNSYEIKSDWGKSELVDSKYDTYVLVIGESARKDYHHAFGYPIENTPFMSNNGMLVDGLTSGGTNTVASLRLMLTEPDRKNWEVNYNLTLIDLIKSANIKTYWISNQGYFGKYDTPVSAIARRSDSKYFVKSGEYNSQNTSDYRLVDQLKNVLNENKKEKKFIVVHLYGSHPNACDRVNDYKKVVNVKDKNYDYINCYITSIKKTDDVLSQINSLLKEKYNQENETYSLVYFSDHGLFHTINNGAYNLNNSQKSAFHYNIPLFKISSDTTKQSKCTSFKSGLNFANGIASWVGIHNDKLKADYSLFDCKSDPNDFGLTQKIDAIKGERAPDPAIDIREK